MLKSVNKLSQQDLSNKIISSFEFISVQLDKINPNNDEELELIKLNTKELVLNLEDLEFLVNKESRYKDTSKNIVRTITRKVIGIDEVLNMLDTNSDSEFNLLMYMIKQCEKETIRLRDL